MGKLYKHVLFRLQDMQFYSKYQIYVTTPFSKNIESKKQK